jgi:hypothetical protein
MIEVKVAGLRLTGFNGNNTTVAKGSFMYKAGSFVATAGTHDPPGTFGNANVGDLRMLPATQYTHSGFGVFPVNKLILQREGADQDLDTIASGTSLIYYQGGQYETDEYDITVSGVSATNPSKAGVQLWLNSTGQIAEGTGGAGEPDPAGWNLPPIGEIVRVSDFPATSRWFNGGNATGVDSFKKTVWYELYPWHAAPAGNVMH